MTINYSLAKEDFLTYQLYTASNSKTINKRQFRARILIPIFYLAFAVYLYVKGSDLLAPAMFVLFSVMWYYGYPYFIKKRYKKLFARHIDQNYSGKLNVPTTITFGPESMVCKDANSEATVDNSALIELIELIEHNLLRLNSGDALIVPKRAVENPIAFITFFKDLDIPYIDALDWTWD